MTARGVFSRFPSLRAGFSVGAGTFVRMVAGFAKTKLAALWLGASGVGLLGIGGQVQLLGITWGSLSISAGFIRSYGQTLAAGQERARREVLATAFSILCLTNTLLVLVMVLFHRAIGGQLFGAAGSPQLVLAAALGIPFQALIGAYLQGILYAHDRYDSWSRANAMGAVIELALFVAGAWWFGVAGAFWALGIGMVFWAGCVLRECLKVERLGNIFALGFSRRVLGLLAAASSATIATSTFAYLAGMLIRVKLLDRFGADVNGAYQASAIISGLYTQLVLNSIWASLYPAAGRPGTKESLDARWAESLLVTAGAAAFFQVSILLAPALLTAVIFRTGFTGVGEFLVWQLWGDFFFLLAQPGLAVLLGRGKFRAYAAIWCSYYALTVAVPLLLFDRMGAIAVNVAYLGLSFGLAAVSLAVFLRRRPALPKNFARVLVALALVVSGAVALHLVGPAMSASHLAGRFFCWILVGLISLAVLRAGDREEKGMSALNRKTKIFNGLRAALLAAKLDRPLARICSRPGAPRWLVKLAPNHYQYPKESLRAVSREGFRYQLDVGDFLDWHIYYGQMEGAKDRLYELASAGDVVIDVGANIGETALHLGRRVGSTGRIIAFEPDPVMREKCRRNVSLNVSEEILLEPFALSDQAGQYRLHRVSERNPAGNRILTDVNAPTESVVVEAKRLDDYVDQQRIGRVSLVKVDVEGFEYRVMKGAERLVKRFRPRLFLELSDANLRQQGSSAEALLSLLKEWNYDVREAVTGGALATTGIPADLHCDVICTPRPEISSR